MQILPFYSSTTTPLSPTSTHFSLSLAFIFAPICDADPPRCPWKRVWMNAWRPWISSLTTTSMRAWRGCGQGNTNPPQSDSRRDRASADSHHKKSHSKPKSESSFSTFMVECSQHDVSSIQLLLWSAEDFLWCEPWNIGQAGFRSPGCQVFAEADAQGRTDSTGYRTPDLQCKHIARDGTNRNGRGDRKKSYIKIFALIFPVQENVLLIR